LNAKHTKIQVNVFRELACGSHYNFVSKIESRSFPIGNGISTSFCGSFVFFLFRPARAWYPSPGQAVLRAALGTDVPNQTAALQGQDNFLSPSPLPLQGEDLWQQKNWGDTIAYRDGADRPQSKNVPSLTHSEQEVANFRTN
jgi:hypothetical protein